ncbi:MAG: DUF4097 family beta strand repeat-containing protein [Aristaeellaceae bacterium]
MLLALCVGLLGLTGCQLQLSLGADSWITEDCYPHAESYQAGSFTCRAQDVARVEIDWRCGEVELVQTDGEELQVRESGEGLSQEMAMHHLLEDGTLRIRFCASGASIHVSSDDKRLTVEVPRGVALTVRATSAAVRAEALEQDSVTISTLSGGIALGTVVAGSVDLSSSSGQIRADSVTAPTLTGNTSSGAFRIGQLLTDTASIATSSGAVELSLAGTPQLTIRTASGRTVLNLPEGGAEIAFSAQSGSLRTARAFDRQGDRLIFADGKAQISVHSASGNLEIQ